MNKKLIYEIKTLLDQLKDPYRFWWVETEHAYWFYDSFINDIFPLKKSLVKNNAPSSKQLEQIITSLTIDDAANTFYILTKLQMSNKDTVQIQNNTEIANVMINTSHRCTLNCTYCYRDKKDNISANIKLLKDAIDFVIKYYKPNASGYIFTYSMSSESSVDLPLLEQILELYPEIESHYFTEKDIVDEKTSLFLCQLEKDLNNTKLFNVTNTSGSLQKEIIVNTLNKILENPYLYEVLNMTEKMIDKNTIEEIKRKSLFSKWLLLRLNRKLLEIKYAPYVREEKFSWLTFCIFTNGTCANEKFISFLKKIDLRKLIISLDGPKEIHNHNRIYQNTGNGSYDDIVRNIKTFLNCGFELECSAVITPFYPKPLDILIHIKSLGFSSISMVPVRYGSEISFNEQSIKDLINGYEELFCKIEYDLLHNNYDLIQMLKDDMTFAPIKSILERNKRLTRCDIDNQLVIDSDGTIYNCLYFCGDKQNTLGNIYKTSNIQKNSVPYITQRTHCNSCWARYMCGGTCYYTSYKENKTYTQINKTECMLNKYICERSVKLLIFIKENQIDIDQFIFKLR